MGTVLASATYDARGSIGGVQYDLCVTTRIGDTANAITSEQMQGMVAHTIATWQRAMSGVLTGTFEIEKFKGQAWPSAEEKQGVTYKEVEPYVTVWNKRGAPINITVQSWDNGYYALETAKDLILGLAKFKEYSAAFGFDSFEFSPIGAAPTPKASPAPAKSQASANTGQKDLNNVDDFIPPYNGGLPASNEAPKHDGHPTPSGLLPFRYFKRLAPNIIQLQEFKQGGGGEKYEKSAIEGTQPHHKETPQYDEGALIYLPIVGVIQFKEGKYGKQAIIPTVKGKVYVDATDSKGQEKPEWATLSSDFYTEYERLNNDDEAKLLATGAVLVLKASAVMAHEKKGQVQYKNYYRIYQELPK